MLSFERTRDIELITRIATHPKIWDKITDDGCPDLDKYVPAIHESIWYVLVRKDSEPAGVWMLYPQGLACAELHVCLLPSLWGKLGSLQAFKGMLDWAWHYTHFARLEAKVPAYNRLAYRYALRAGLVEYGVSPKSFMKNGILHDQILLGICKPEA